jgi:S13-like H2TH domain
MTTITPGGDGTFERTAEQRFAALQRANEIRTARAQLKKRLEPGAGGLTVSQILANPPDYVETMKVYDLLMAIPKWGITKSLNAMRAVDIAPGKTVGGLSPRQRRELLRWLHGR